MNICLKSFFIVLVSCLFSFILYTVSWPYFSESSNSILKSISSISLTYVLILKVVELLLYFMTEHVYDTIFLVFIARIPWLYICYLLSSSPLWMLLLLVISDMYILTLPFYLLSYHRCKHSGDKNIGRRVISWSNQDSVLIILLSLLISSIHSIVVYIVSRLILVPLLLHHFNTELFIAPVPLPILIFFFLPLGFSIQKVVLSLGLLKGFFHMAFTMAWVTATYLFLFIQNITLYTVFVSFSTFLFTILISLLAIVLCF